MGLSCPDEKHTDSPSNSQLTYSDRCLPKPYSNSSPKPEKYPSPNSSLWRCPTVLKPACSPWPQQAEESNADGR